jgi:hypothetical protein
MKQKAVSLRRIIRLINPEPNWQDGGRKRTILKSKIK